MKKAAFYNLGCKVNAYETQAMQEMLEKNGYEIVPFKEKADVYIVNTCTVTNMADRKSRQILHKARKANPEAVVVAAGCYAQIRGEGAREGADLVIGNHQKKDLVSLLERYRGERGAGEEPDIAGVKEEGGLCISKASERTRAYIKVQDGCNQFCSYCIIPYARGRVRSRGKEEVVSEVRKLARGGYKEVVLTGIHLSSYGMDCGEDLLSLIQAVHKVEGIERIRLGSLEPRVITEEFAAALLRLPRVCPHFHLSLQSGCNATLKRMNRRYTAEEYEKGCRLLRTYFKDPALTTDIIVGFPGETQEEFEESMEFIDKINFYRTHIFKYSRREGTRAAVMERQVEEEIKAKRSRALMELGARKRKAYEERLIGKTKEALMEEEVRINGEIYQAGHTREYVKIGLKTRENLSNQLVNVEIESRLQIIH